MLTGWPLIDTKPNIICEFHWVRRLTSQRVQLKVHGLLSTSRSYSLSISIQITPFWGIVFWKILAAKVVQNNAGTFIDPDERSKTKEIIILNLPQSPLNVVLLLVRNGVCFFISLALFFIWYCFVLIMLCLNKHELKKCLMQVSCPFLLFCSVDIFLLSSWLW